ncbi:hypothetical protein B0T11DRAFT_292382 [Plectosphaerella cucumerina]|uniref:Cutinase n=1 Tax=Plectosphaerella cucumerina TaxID=40658 RepID=A0A8K0X779_9PEZI|nr:hypothetical protein B0T11DRAFT_292382 [Plectosphaerella cucumerina]
MAMGSRCFNRAMKTSDTWSIAESYAVVYPAGFDQNVTSGVQNTLDIVKYGLENCPNQKYLLFGYSQGASVVLEALAKMFDAATAASNGDNQGRPDTRPAFDLFATHAMQANHTNFLTYSSALDGSGKVSDICIESDIVTASDS